MTAIRFRHAQCLSVALAALLLGAWAACAQPRLDCAKATGPAERLVCASPELAGLDEMLARALSVAVGKLAGAGNCLHTDQARWLRTVRNACADDACLQRAYRLRLGELNPLQSGASLTRDVPRGPELIAVVPPGSGIRAADAPVNPDPQPMTAEGRLAEDGGGYVLTTANGERFVMQNFYFSAATLKQLNDILAAAPDRTRFRVSGTRAAIPGKNLFEPRRCILLHRLPE